MTRILVVDDNRDLAENIVEILVEAGFAADCFDDPRCALEALVPGVYDLALLDLRMPGMDGIELYRALKRRDPNLAAIAMTAFAQDDSVRDAVDAGVLAVFPKPVDSAMLLVRLAAAVGLPAALVVEDDVDLARDLAETLAGNGFAPYIAHSCAAAREICDRVHPVVLMVDWRLPDGDGIELVEALCHTVDGSVAVVFSGHTREYADPDNRIQSQGITFLEKPLDIPRLLRVLGPARTSRLPHPIA